MATAGAALVSDRLVGRLVDRLVDRVAGLTIIDQAGGEARVLPGPGAVMGLQLLGHVSTGGARLSPAGVTGIQKTARSYGYAHPTRTLLVRFTPQGARCLGVPASELAMRNVALEDVLGARRAREVTDRFVAADTPARAVAVVEDLLAALPFTPDPAIERAIAMLGAGRDEDRRVAAVARALGFGERQLERRFLDRVGVSPRQFASLARFQRAVALARTAPSLTRAAIEAGLNQSHFIREFKRFAGMSPEEWLGR